MDLKNFSSEIGQKMRSAIKAKLLELGSGSATGYIDDELPDYVMIMVANKRSKQQMAADLDLFLGSKTELFVTWLHEVLQKLQEVTLPVTALSSKTRKEGDQTKKKDKKSARKEKKTHVTKELENSSRNENSAISTEKLPIANSITDVFAEDILEKAQTSLDISNAMKEEIKKKKQKQKEQYSNEVAGTTIAEISSTTGSSIAAPVINSNREKDLEELAKLQQKIDAAKKFLRKTGELVEQSASEDEDYLNIRADDDVSGAEETFTDPKETRKIDEENPPLNEVQKEDTSNKNVENSRKTEECEEAIEERHTPEQPYLHESEELKNFRENELHRIQQQRLPKDNSRTFPNERERDGTFQPRPSVHERLGKKVQDNTTQNRYANELCRERERERIRHGISPIRLASRNTRSRSRHNSSSSPVRQRIVSRIIVPNCQMQLSPAKEDGELERPVNSVIKVKPRPTISPRRQAPKNLLMRAMAEAQRSTILSRSKICRKRSESPINLNTKIRRTESRRDSPAREGRRLRISSNGELFRRTTKGIVCQVQTSHQKVKQADYRMEIDEYEPAENKKAAIDNTPYVPLPNNRSLKLLSLANHLNDEKDPEVYVNNNPEPKFVVTLDANALCAQYEKNLRLSPVPQVSSSSSAAKKRKIRYNKRRRRMSDATQKLAKIDDTDNSPPSRGGTPSPRGRSTVQQKRGVHGDVLRHAVDFNRAMIVNPDEDDDAGGKRHETKTCVELKEDLEGTTTPPLPKARTLGNIIRVKTSNTKTTRYEATPPPKTHTSETKEKGLLINCETAIKDITVFKSPVRETSIKRTSPFQDVERNNTKETKPESRKISMRLLDDKKYDNIPALSTVLKPKPKQLCAFSPNCTKQFCEFYHPTAQCKSFPNCKFADKCLYQHPKCKFDMACVSPDCIFSHSGTRKLPLIAPPLSSHVIPVQNYKSISAATGQISTTTCKYFPNCTNPSCNFLHPKPCRYGKFCTRQQDCSYYHPELQSSNKFKWIATA